MRCQIIVLSFVVLAFLPACAAQETATANAASTAAQPAIPTAATTPSPAATATTMPTATPEPLSDAELGELVFKTRFPETSGRHCGYCHNTNEAESERVSLIGIASTAGERVEGLSAEAYIRQSILDPAAYLVEGKDPDAMPRIYGDILSEDDINHLIAYLMSLE
jgi:cytochrome c553